MSINQSGWRPEMTATSAANDTGAAASQVLSSAGSLSQQTEQLTREVREFVEEVRAA